jgi:two-component system response regulator NreC
MTPSTPVSSKKSRVLVVDDHPMVRGGLIRLINQQCDLMCCGEAADAAETQAAVAALLPDLVILDLRLKSDDGLELIKSLKCRFPALRILVLSQHDAPLYIERALRAGALGYLLKDQAADEVITAIRTVLKDEVYLMRWMAALLLHRIVGNPGKTSRSGLERLTDRELHVLHLLGAGLSTRSIAAELNLSFKTVETHRENIKGKLGLRDASQLVHYATEWACEQVSMPPQAVPALAPEIGA